MPSRTVSTWNVNSIRARETHVLEWLEEHAPDALCLQETKTPDERFPLEAMRKAGYHAATAGQRTYNGVAILGREPLKEVRRGFPDNPDPSQARVISASLEGLRLINVYVPNGSEVGSDRFEYKLAWLEAFRAWLEAEHDPSRPLLVAGDFNIAPADEDVHDPEAWKGKVLCSEAERKALRRILEWGLSDLFRCHDREAGRYSWWDYRAGRFRRDHGLRIDLLLGTAPLAGSVREVSIDREARARPKPSDHAPVTATFGPAS